MVTPTENADPAELAKFDRLAQRCSIVRQCAKPNQRTGTVI